MDDLLQWLGEQLDEDRSIALLACATGGEPDVLGDGETPVPWRADHVKVFIAGRRTAAEATSSSRAMHIARHDPARVLREIDAKRDLLVFAKGIHDHHETFATGVYARLEKTLRLYAIAYKDRPGYREEWRP